LNSISGNPANPYLARNQTGKHGAHGTINIADRRFYASPGLCFNRLKALAINVIIQSLLKAVVLSAAVIWLTPWERRDDAKY
jgi:hypothetical protein